MPNPAKPWLAVLIVAAFALCAGFVAGAAIGMRERAAAKAHNHELTLESARLSERVAEAAVRNEKLVADLERAMDQIDEYKDLSRSSSDDTVSHADLGPPMLADVDPSNAEERLAQLECEVAALKESIREAALVGPPPPRSAPFITPATESVLVADGRDSAAAKLQCSAITKKGTRCSRPARANGKCWQHGG